MNKDAATSAQQDHDEPPQDVEDDAPERPDLPHAPACAHRLGGECTCMKDKIPEGVPAPWAREPEWVLLYWSFAEQRAPMQLVLLEDTDPNGPWDDDTEPFDYAHWLTQEAALAWAAEHMPRLHPNCYYLAFDYATCWLYTS